jgi:hypothetical protein
MRYQRAGRLVTGTGAVIAALAVLLPGYAVAGSAGPVVQVSADPYTNPGPQHATEVEPDTVAVGQTVVSVFQAGRWDNGCSDDIGWAASHNAGAGWVHGFLPGLTAFSTPRGPFYRASDPSVAYDAKFGDWVASSLPCNGKSARPTAYVPDPGITVNLSSNGTKWGNAIIVARVPLSDHQFGTDKNWVTCDNSTASRFYGHCYMEWDVVADQVAHGDLVMMSTSTNGGRTWSPPVSTTGGLHATGGEPVVEPDGTVVVPIVARSGIVAFRSVNGGKTWGPAVPVARIFQHFPAGNLRGPIFPSVAINDGGTIYITWPDCRFRPGCASNDMVLTTSSTEGRTWTPVRRIPIDPVTSSVDHLGGGLGADPTTSGAAARLGLFYYFYPRAACTVATCRLKVGYISSTDGGARWSRARLIAGPMKLTQLAYAFGHMVGDYVGAAVIPGGNAFAAFAVGGIPADGQAFSEPMYQPYRGEPITGGTAPASAAGLQPGLREAPMPGITR